MASEESKVVSAGEPIIPEKQHWVVRLISLFLLILVASPVYISYQNAKAGQTKAKSTGNSQQPAIAVCEETKNSEDLVISEEKPKFQKTLIQRNCSSEVIEIPGGRCFKIKAPGWLEYQFTTGQKVEVGENENKIFPMPSSRFRLKGKSGIAKIWLEPCK